MTLPEVALFLFFLVANGFLATARSALVNVRKARLRQLIEEGSAPARAAERLAEDASRLLATAQLGMMLTSFFAGGVVAVVSTPPLERLLAPWLGDAAYPVAFVVVLFAAAWIMLILGELVPEMVGAQYSERLALWLARPLALVSIVAMPIVRLTVWIANMVARLFGSDVRRELPFVTEEEIKTLVDAGEEEGVIQEEEKEMIYSIFELGDTLAREVMVPRIDVVALDENTPMLDALGTIMEAGFSRIPVFRETIDNILGVLYTKDLLPYLRDGRTDVPLNKVLRTAYFVPETKKASDLLPDLQQRRVHMAVVVDEYGGMAGVVTIEDLLEEIVGEIQDEYDSEEPFVQFVGDDEYILDARVDLDDLNRLMDASLPTEDSDTLGGFIYSELGKVPVVGDHVSFANLDFAVESVAGRRIKKVRVRRVAAARPAPEEAESEGPAEHGAAHENGVGNGNGHGKRRWSQ
ncbi:MAG: HlyC/CorC family transporter [Anaerolineae bacterium]|nr:HlyC/CorC family transporter [Anaerolineae bacterium]